MASSGGSLRPFLVLAVFLVAGCGARDQLLVGDAAAAGGQGGSGGTAGSGGAGSGGGGAGTAGMGGGGSGGAPPSIPVVEQLSLGAGHTCVLGQDGSVWCWGDNSKGQLGVPTVGAESLVPVRVDLGLATRIAVGYDHTCALVAPEAGPQVVCWGNNGLGQATAYPTDAFAAPTPVPGTEGATEVAAGQFHTCAKKGEQVVCWGDNEQGQLGTGSVGGTSMGLPLLVQDMGSNLQGLALGAHHSCATGGMGPVCWGENIDGELGLPPPMGSAVPVQVPSGAGYLSSKGHFTCGLEGLPDPEGPVCWGDNDSGQLALGTKSPNEAPGLGALAPMPEALAAGITHACALGVEGSVFCWGSNYNGQLGISGADSYVPQKVPSLSGVTRLAAGTLHTCAANAEPGVVLCWGTNDYGQLGSGTKNGSAIPVAVMWPD